MLRGLLTGAADALIARATAAVERGEFALSMGKSGCLQAGSYRRFAFDVLHEKGLRDATLVQKWNRFEPRYQAQCNPKTSKSFQSRFVVPVTTDTKR